MIDWKGLNKRAVLIYGSGKVRHLMDSENFGIEYEVGDDEEYYTVTISGQGRFTCTCKKCIYIPEYMCCHKLSVILFSQREIFK